MTEHRDDHDSATGSGAGVADEATSATLRKIAIRLIPLLFLCYIAAYINRTNVGFAKAQMESDLGFSDAVYGLGAGVFFISYFLFELPSNMWMMKVGARKTISRIMILWGLVAAAMLFVTNPVQFYILRFLLGAAEAGFAPAVIVYLTFWFPAAWRARMLAMFLVAVPVSGIIGGPLAGLILTALDDRGGLRGWQWLFLVEGMVPIILGLVVLAYLNDGPHKARWLSDRERVLVQRALDTDTDGDTRHIGLRSALRDSRLWVMSFIYFTISAGIFLIAFWLPTIINQGNNLSDLQVGLLYAIPYVVALIAMVAVSTHSDRTNERAKHLGICGILASAAFLFSVAAPNLAISIAIFSVATAGVITMMPIFWTLPPKVFTGAAAAGSVAIINSIGTLSGFVSPYFAGWVRGATGSTSLAVLLIGALLSVGTVVGFVAAKRLERQPAGR